MRRARLTSLLPVMGLLAIALAGQQAAAPAQGGAQRAREYLDLPVSIEAPIRPAPVKGTDGRWYLVYHLFLTNWSYADLTLARVEVTGDEGVSLVRYDDAELGDSYRFRSQIPTTPRSELPKEFDPRQIPSGRTGVLFFWLTLDDPKTMPATLSHRLTFAPNPLVTLAREAAPEPGGEMVLDGFTVDVGAQAAIEIGPPLRGGPWLCSNGPAYDTAHQYLGIHQGRVRIAQRFAIDFQKLDAENNILPNPFPDEITNEMFYGYGAEVLAVADGVVTFVKDGIPENVPQASGEIVPAVPITRETVSGNTIGLDLGQGRYAFYAHLQPGSLRVKLGEAVKKGQVIGLVGNSGNAVGPHLHFHVGDANSLNGSEGLPFVLDVFEVIGETDRRTLQMPLDEDILRFHDR